MFKFSLWLFLALTTAFPAASFEAARSPHELKPEPQQAQVAHLTADLISRYHYRAPALDDVMSEKIFDRYLKSLDGEKLYFTQADIDRWAAMRTRLDDAIIDEDIGNFFVIFNRYVRRVAERTAYARGLLGAGFDFTQRESYRPAREKAAWPQSEAELRELWRQRVKNDWLRLELAGMQDKRIAATLDRRYDNTLKRIARLRSEDVFQMLMNAYTTAIEPHTTFNGPRAAEDSSILMKLSMVGIGLVLIEKDGYPTVRELVPGSPSALSGRLNIGDRIVGVARDTSHAMTDVQGWRMDDIVALIRGAAGSAVMLEVLPADADVNGRHRSISLIRAKLALEEHHAKKTVLAVTDGAATRHIGVITLPSFYHDFGARDSGERNFRGAARDVARLLGELEKEQVDGVLIDLRDNGGGSLTEAIELTGLFVGAGPVLQQRDAKGAVSVERDTGDISDRRAGLAWRGPLGVLINRGSASASEIFAAAIQDYGRGLVIGETSYGKGTVQALISLDQVAIKGQPKLGELRLTVAQFFRIEGGTTQLRGVTPDIVFSAASATDRFGESAFDNPLPWTQVRAAAYAPLGDLKALLPILLRRHQARVQDDPEFQYLKEDIAEAGLQRAGDAVSLHQGERRADRAALEARWRARETRRGAFQPAGTGEAAAQRRLLDLLDDGLQADERSLASELAAESSRKNVRDVFLHEAASILGDEVGLSRRSPDRRAMSGPAER